MTPRFGGLLHSGHKDYGQDCGWTIVGVVRGRGARLSERTPAKFLDVASLRRGKCSGQYMRNFYCLGSELAFLLMQCSLPHNHVS